MNSSGDDDEQGILAAARAVRPFLPDLVGPDSGRVDGRLADLLAAARRGENVTGPVRSVLKEHEATADFLAEILDDAPRYLPYDLRPENLLVRNYQELPSPGPGPVDVEVYVCAQGDYTFYQLAADDLVPPCRTHGTRLNLSPET
jgi:hypothetical protein